jgi:hypothetical protein
MVSLLWCLRQNQRIASVSFFRGCRKKRLTLTPKIDCEQTAYHLIRLIIS